MGCVLSTRSSSPVCRLWTKFCVPLSQHLTRRKQFVRAISLCRRFCGMFSFVLFKLMLSSRKLMFFFHHRNTTNTYNKLVSRQEQFFLFQFEGKINPFKLLLSGLIAISFPDSIGITPSGPCKSYSLYFRASCNLVKSSVHWMFVRLVSVPIPSFLVLNAASVQSHTEFLHFKEENRLS